MAINDLFKLDLIGNIGGSLAVNTFTYRAGTIDVDSNDIAIEFNATVLPQISAVEGIRKAYESIKVLNLFDPEDTSEVTATTTDGIVVGEDGGGHTAIPMKLISGTRDIRDGAKRFGPLSENYNADGVITGAGMLTELDDLATALGATLDLGSGHTAVPVVVKRIPYEVEDSGNTAYRLPENAGEAVWTDVLEVVPVLRATTQNSRKTWQGE